MDFFRKQVEAAQAQARLAASTAGKLAEQLTDQTKVLAEQASTFGKATAEQAGQRIKELHIGDHLDKLAEEWLVFVTGVREHHPKNSLLSCLARYGITPDFKDFVRSLTYSTFRDFPSEELEEPSKDAAVTGSTAPAPMPWQERHAMLVVQEVHEINELRFVLVPKRMTDEHFWQVYFVLSRQYLPGDAFDPEWRLPQSADAPQDRAAANPLNALAIRGRLQQLTTAAQSRWTGNGSPHKGGVSPSFVDQLGEVASQGLKLHSSPSAAAEAGAGAPAASPREAPGNGASQSHGEGAAAAPAELVTGVPANSRSAEDDDFEKYISGVVPDEGGSGSDGDDEGSGLDLDEYMQELQEEEDKDEHH